MAGDSSAFAPAGGLSEALQGCRARFNDAQRRRLRWLSELKGRPSVWSGQSELPANCRFALVIEPPNGLQLERLLASFARDAVVVIPCGENPAYDRLKARLFAFGTVGVEGASGPHQMWWGGCSRLTLRLPARIDCADSAAHVTMAACCPERICDDSMHESPPIVPDLRSTDVTPADRILSTWQSSERPVIWARDRADSPTASAEMVSIDCDFAVFKKDRWRFQTDILYFGRRAPAAALLRTWAGLCRQFPGVDDGILLDQAWCLVTSQTGLDTFWLPMTCGRSGPTSLPRSALLVDQDDRDERAFGTAERPVDQFFAERLKMARGAERTGFPDVLQSAPTSQHIGRSAIVVIRDVKPEDSRALSALVEALAIAFATDPGGFRQLEIAICARRDDLVAALQSAPVDRALVITPHHSVPTDTFCRLAQANDRIVITGMSAVVIDLTKYRSHLDVTVSESVGQP